MSARPTNAAEVLHPGELEAALALAASETRFIRDLLASFPLGLSMGGVLHRLKPAYHASARATVDRMRADGALSAYLSDDDPPVEVYTLRDRPLIARHEPPPAVLCHGLTEEQRATVQRLADMLRAGPLDREALGREARARHWTHGRTVDEEWPLLPEDMRERWRNIGEHLYRIGAAAGDVPLREAVRDVLGAWGERRDDAWAPTLERLQAAYDAGPVMAAREPVADALGGHGEELLFAAERVVGSPGLDRFRDRLRDVVSAIGRVRAALSAPVPDTGDAYESFALSRLAGCDPIGRSSALKALASFLDLSPPMRRHVAAFVAGLADE